MMQGHKADWKIYNSEGEMILSLNCLYDSNDFLSEIADSWEIDYKNKVIRVTKEITG